MRLVVVVCVSRDHGGEKTFEANTKYVGTDQFSWSLDGVLEKVLQNLGDISRVREMLSANDENRSS